MGGAVNLFCGVLVYSGVCFSWLERYISVLEAGVKSECTWIY